MINISKIKVNDIPILMVANTEQMKEQLKTVVYYHGFNGEKESSLTIAYKIAEKGFRVILPDSIYHGDRREDMSQTELDLAFWDIVFQNIAQLNDIKEYLEKENLVIPGHIGIGGTSMGGMTVYGALKKYDWVKAAVVLMGTPQLTTHANKMIDTFNKANEKQIKTEVVAHTLEEVKQIDLSHNFKKLANRPLLVWHGEKDPIIPVTQTESVIKEIESEYDVKENVKFIIEKGRTHNISRLSIEETAKWFSQHL